MREWLFGWGDATPEELPRPRQRLLTGYAWSTWVYRAFMFLGIAVLVYYFFFKVLHASAGIEGEEHEGEEHDEHEEHAENDEHDEHEGEDEHGAFVAAYEFECADIDSLGSIEFTYFNQFDNAQSLEIVLIDGSGQSQVEIDRASPVLQLKK